MLPFLDYAAKEILKITESKDFEHTVIVLPSKRSVYFFKKSFSLVASGTFYAPKIISIDEFIVSNSGLEIIENVELYLKAYEFWKKVDDNQTLESFISWIPTLIKDFENIDFACLDAPHQLFKYMSEAKSIERWEIDSEFKFSETAHGYFSFFDKVAVLYDQLKEYLINNKLAYRGLAYRVSVQNIQQSEIIANKSYFFIGLNALTTAEEKIIKYLVSIKKAKCIWDTDDFYMNSMQKAGKKLFSYKKSNLFGEWNSQFSFLQNTAKVIRVFETSTDNLQINIANNLLKEKPVNHVLIVLDENLFLPLIYMIPDNSIRLNISIGLPILQSKLFSFFSIILNNFNDYHSLGRISHANISLLYSNYHFKKLYPQSLLESDFKGKNKAFFEKIEIHKSKNELCNFIVSSNNMEEFLQKLKSIFEKFYEIEASNQLELMFLITLIPKIEILIQHIKSGLDINYKLLQTLFNEFLKNEKVPFESEFESPIQIMSLLESRCLDFENVTFLSFLEGNLPSKSKQNSFIPNDAAYYFKLPIYEDQDSIMAYHFFRLLQRATNINLIYSKGGSSKGVGGKEKSRFLTIIENQLIYSNPNIAISYPKVLFENLTETIIPAFEEVHKNENHIQKVKKFLTERGLSATALNDYLSCGFKFYLKNIENISPEAEIEKNIGSDIIGQIVHKVLEVIDKDLPIKDLKKLYYEKAIVKEYADKIFDLYKDQFEIQYGLNLIVKTITGKLLEDYYDLRIKEFKDEFKVKDNELKIVNYLNYKDLSIKIKGIIDKIEIHESYIAVIDFKTGKVEKSNLKLPKDSDSLENISKPKFDKLRQLLLYNWLLENNSETQDIFSTGKNTILIIYSFRNLNEKIEMDSEIFEFAKNENLFEKLIQNMVDDLMNNTSTFKKTKDKTQCTFCDYKNICFRG